MEPGFGINKGRLCYGKLKIIEKSSPGFIKMIFPASIGLYQGMLNANATKFITYYTSVCHGLVTHKLVLLAVADNNLLCISNSEN